MAAKVEQKKWTAAQIKEQIQKIQEVIERYKRENKQEYFMAITPEEIEKKLKRVKSPIITSQGWSKTMPGGTLNYDVTIYNPDPHGHSGLFVHAWVGSGNVDPTVGTFLLNVDARFSRLTEPKLWSGLNLAAGASGTLHFALRVPSSVEEGAYLCNSCLMHLCFSDGTYLDRGVIVFTVSSP